MAAQLGLYEQAAPVNSTRHRDWSVKVGSDYGFARKINSVPLLLAEFAQACAEYAVVFTGGENDAVPAAVLGIRAEENLFVDAAGAWLGRYVPAFIRRYPFVFASQDDGANFTLCIDESFAGCNQQGRGERLFDADGTRTQYLETMLNFLQVFQAEYQRSRAFCERLGELGLLEDMQAQIALSDGRRVALDGFRSLNREKLNALAGEALEGLARAQFLEPAYGQLLSLQNLARLAAPAASGETTVN